MNNYVGNEQHRLIVTHFYVSKVHKHVCVWPPVCPHSRDNLEKVNSMQTRDIQTIYGFWHIQQSFLYPDFMDRAKFAKYKFLNNPAPPYMTMG